MQPIFIVLIIIAALIIIILFSFILIYNKIKRLRIKINEAESDIDVALTKRHDCLLKARDVAKSYVKYEPKTLQDVIKMRPGMSIEQKIDENKKMDAFFHGFYAVAEQYPDLKASPLYANLQNLIQDVEEHLQASRRLFNSNVSIYNQSIAVFPNSIIAGMFNFKPCQFFETTEEEKQDIDMNF